MTQPAPDSRVDPVRAAIDSTTMLVLARFFMPAVVAVLGWFLTGVLDDLKRDSRAVQQQVSHLSEQQAQTGAVVTAAGKQLDRLQMQVDSLQRHN